MSKEARSGKIIVTIVLLAAIATAAVLGVAFYFSSSSIHSLLTENHKLNKAIRNLTDEQQIGFATLKSRSRNELGQVESLVRFVQTAPGNPDEVISEELFVVEGEVIHFDALIVKFGDEYVKDGKGRALYLWRRIYGDGEAPSEGAPIQKPGQAPERYSAITQSLRLKNQPVFWEAIWELANNPRQLSEYDIQAVFGNAIYTRMEPEKVYLFKISPTGQIYPEVLSYQ
ncbi:hypothetical protein DDZ13_09220 [Coraliomargarita sinensis]|uniref:Uncharacterized protein n=1 Tax=Coraliomargarita sinensis TaxID=2174842 RepID=A0A317ZHW3_9BACT|nr:hypothetical protein [Coraliomargarita sinensis]PXA03813.1 hypothetical protein DDZ13_09220 [Coraliomargarita sinensis]